MVSRSLGRKPQQKIWRSRRMPHDDAYSSTARLFGTKDGVRFTKMSNR
jgi:hypothetical protein